MEFRTQLDIEKGDFEIDYNSKILLLGSCFSEEIGRKLFDNKFAAVANPLGTIFNPVSISKAVLNNRFNENHIIHRDGVYFHHDFHSEINATTPKGLIDKIALIKGELDVFLSQVDVLILTLGTAYVHRSVQTNEVVSNCHKVPAKNFTKELLDIDTIVDSLSQFTRFTNLKKVILTVSPVRHTKDTIPLNSLSKATLRVACEQLVNKNDLFEYFPSYELVIDDLRDYRFFKVDMIHPNDVAVDYIWQKFLFRYMTDSTIRLLNRVNKVLTGLKHRPFNPKSNTHQKFLQSLSKELEALGQELDFSEEMDVVNRLITKDRV